MRSNVNQYELVAPGTLDAVLQILAASPDHYTPIAGGTELMVALGAGRLQPKNSSPFGISTNSASSKSLQTHSPSAQALPSPTSANTPSSQKNSPSSPRPQAGPAHRKPEPRHSRRQHRQRLTRRRLATRTPRLRLNVTLVSTRGARTIPYNDFHLAYKETALEPDELLHSITLLRNLKGYKSYIRKVGPRNAQAISKVALAGLPGRRGKERSFKTSASALPACANILPGSPQPKKLSSTNPLPLPPSPPPALHPHRSSPHRRHPQHGQISRHRSG